MFLTKQLLNILMEANGAGSGAGGQGAAGTGAQGAGASQGNGTGQGTPTATATADGFWGNFPDVPEAQREILAPHLKTIEGHVTQMQQRMAPYQGVMDKVEADQVQNLIGFLDAYNSNPAATVLGLLQQEFQSGNITAEQLAELTGQQPGQQAQPGQQEGQGQQEEMPAWARQMQQQLAQYQEREQQEEAARVEQEQAQTLQTAQTNIRGQLDTQGIPAELVTDEMITAAIIANNGDEAAAANMFAALRDGFLGNFTQSRTAPGTQPRVNGQLPKPPAKGQRKGDGFDEARTGAKQFLEQQRQMAGA
jgi:hypothetical protein